MIIEKLLPQELEDAVHDAIMSKKFRWNWNSETIVRSNVDGELFQMTHLIMIRNKIWSDHYSLVNMIIGAFVEKTKIKLKKIIRIKVNLIPNIAHDKSVLKNIIHTDVELNKKGNFVSIVYYVTDSDGDTAIFEDDKETVKLTSPPIKGNCVWFNSKTFHRSCVPIHHKRRVVINFVLEVE